MASRPCRDILDIITDLEVILKIINIVCLTGLIILPVFYWMPGEHFYTGYTSSNIALLAVYFIVISGIITLISLIIVICLDEERFYFSLIFLSLYAVMSFAMSMTYFYFLYRPKKWFDYQYYTSYLWYPILLLIACLLFIVDFVIVLLTPREKLYYIDEEKGDEEEEEDEEDDEKDEERDEEEDEEKDLEKHEEK